MILENFVKDVMAMPEPVDNSVQMDLSNDPKINKDLLKQKILHNVEMSDEELAVLLKESYADILKCIFELDDLQYLQFVTTPRFISSLTRIVSSNLKTLEPFTRIHINKLVYDYITSGTIQDTNEQVQYMNTLMTNLAKIINEDHIRKLIGVGMDMTTAEYMALARFSSMNESVNIKRVNFIICTTLDKSFDMNDEQDRARAEQTVINIYTKLFTKLTVLFESTMFDVWDLEESWVTESISEMYSITTNAMLAILDNMRAADIRTILMTYANDYMSLYAPKGYGTRISMRTLSGDYDRIRFIVEGLQHEENIYVP